MIPSLSLQIFNFFFRSFFLCLRLNMVLLMILMFLGYNEGSIFGLSMLTQPQGNVVDFLDYITQPGVSFHDNKIDQNLFYSCLFLSALQSYFHLFSTYFCKYQESCLFFFLASQYHSNTLIHYLAICYSKHWANLQFQYYLFFPDIWIMDFCSAWHISYFSLYFFFPFIGFFFYVFIIILFFFLYLFSSFLIRLVGVITIPSIDTINFIQYLFFISNS